MIYSYLYEARRPLPAGEYADYFDIEHTAFVSVDMHDGHLSPDPGCPCPAPRGRAIVEAVDDIHSRGRKLGAQVIHVRTGLRPSGVDDVDGIPSAWRRPFAEYVGGIPNIAEHGLEGTRWTMFATRVQPQDEVVTNKKRLSAFYATDLDFLLRQSGITTVVLTGCMTDCCILSTAFDASNMSYRVITVRDCVAGTNPELEDAALKIMSLNTGLVMDADDLIAAWTAARQNPTPTQTSDSFSTSSR